jgi:hypothetical protein
MTKVEEYYKDMERVWSAIVLLGSMLLSFIVVLVSHILWGAR